MYVVGMLSTKKTQLSSVFGCYFFRNNIVEVVRLGKFSHELSFRANHQRSPIRQLFQQAKGWHDYKNSLAVLRNSILGTFIETASIFFAIFYF